eukprot:3170823-Rhodomonas_salina.2
MPREMLSSSPVFDAIYMSPRDHNERRGGRGVCDRAHAARACRSEASRSCPRRGSSPERAWSPMRDS